MCSSDLMSESVSLPALGESVTEGTVTRWLKKVGDRVEVDETDESVTLTVVVGYSGEEGWSCPTAYASRTTTVSLAEPLGTRSLLGCRPEVSFVPKGGYNEPEPRNPSIDCTPQG